MEIQGSINQLLQSAAILGRLAPGYEKRAELRQLNQKYKTYEKQIDLYNLQKDSNQLTPAQLEAGKQLNQKLASLSERRFELDPTIDNLNKYMGTLQSTENIETANKKELLRRKAEESAKASLKEEQQRLANSRSAIRKEILSNTPTVFSKRGETIKYDI